MTRKPAQAWFRKLLWRFQNHARTGLQLIVNSETKFSKEPEVSKRRSPVVLVETNPLVV